MILIRLPAGGKRREMGRERGVFEMRGSSNVEEEDVYSSSGVCESEFVSLRGLDTQRDVREDDDCHWETRGD